MTSSYTLAEIKGNMDITITDSQNALIGISSTIDGGTIQKEISQDLAGYLPVSSNVPVSIKNNMNTKIWVTSKISNDNSDLLVEVDELSKSVEIGPGSTGSMSFLTTASPETIRGKKTINLTFEANWDGGNAIIESQMSIEVIEPEIVESNSLTSITPFVMEYQGNPFYLEVGEIKDDQSSYYNNLDGANQTWMSILHQQHTMAESKEIAKTNEIKVDDSQNVIHREEYERSIAELYQRSIGVSTRIQNAIEEIKISIGQLNDYKVGMFYQQGIFDKSMLIELYQEYTKLYSELQVLINSISNIAKSENIINESDILNISQQIQNYEMNNESLFQRYMIVLSQ